MKLWLLLAREGGKPWEPWYDKAFGFVIRAASEAQARAIAQENGGDEVRPGHFGAAGRPTTAWTDPAHSTCEELTADGAAGMILRDFAAA